MDKLHPSFIER